MAKIYKILLVMVLLFCGGCVPLASQYAPLPPHPKQAPGPGLARIYMIRGYIFWIGSGAGMQITDGGRLVGDVGNASYICWERPAGEMLIGVYGCFGQCGQQLGSAVSSVKMPVEAGMTYYLYLDALSYEPKSITHKEAQKYLAEYPKPQVKSWTAAPKAGPAAAPPPAGAPPSTVKDLKPMPQPGKAISY